MGILRISFFRPLIFFLYHTLCMLFFFFAVLHRLVLKVKRNLKLCMCQCDDYTRFQPLNSPFTYKHEWTNEGLACMTTAEACYLLSEILLWRSMIIL